MLCENLNEWLDLTAWGHKVKLALCIECWTGPGGRLGVYTFEEAAELDVHEIWTGPTAQAIRKSDVCDLCPHHHNPPLLPHHRVKAPPREDPYPSRVNMAYDRSCNLACPSCRWEKLQATGSVYDSIRNFQQKFVRPLLRQVKHALLAGNGDPFGSRLYRELLETVTPEEAPQLEWYLLTNGLGFTQEQFERIPTWNQIREVQVSIDAATPETYLSHRMASWEVLQRNLLFLRALRLSGQIRGLHVSMVFQHDNFREMPDFVQRAVDLGCDSVIFNGLNPLTYSGPEYLSRAVHRPGHPQFQDLLKIIDQVKDTPGIRVVVEIPRADNVIP